MPMGFDPRIADEFLDAARIPLRLAAVTRSGFPALVSLWSVRENGLILCASQANAYIVSKLRENPKAAFEVSCEDPPYRGVRGWCTAEIRPARGREVLEKVLRKFTGGVSSPLARRLLARAEAEVAIELTPVWMKTWDFTVRMKDSLPVVR